MACGSGTRTTTLTIGVGRMTSRQAPVRAAVEPQVEALMAGTPGAPGGKQRLTAMRSLKNE